MAKILHTGDLHIGSYPGPERGGENARFMDICTCLDTMVMKAREQRPDIAVIAGDIFHQAKVWSDRGLKEQRTAVKFLRELSSVCPVVVMRGTPNHDSEEQFKALRSTFEGDDSVAIITEPHVGVYSSYDGRRVNIACVPGFDRGYYRAQHPGLSKEEENEVFTDAIEKIIVGLKAQCDPAYPSVLVSHYTITGCNMESGQTAFFSQFEPVVYPATLAAADFDLACFGHIHRPQQLEGCKNAFYCGAVNALNFNDEGQPRGYYMHEIHEAPVHIPGPVPIPACTSTFHALPAREFKTVRLKDSDIEQINREGPGWLFQLPVLDDPDEVRGKIVRVLYDCTDEHNKAFNHAELERWLYEVGGAFWVQEITPQKITITVDRRSMETDSTPEDNLATFLSEKGEEPERAADLIELARPIIAEATEKATAQRHTGTFLPVEIEVHNYRNYRDETFSFDPIRFCTINGSNGVGKSSLFMDAMLDALYEEPREGELTGWICNDQEARSGSIKFTFLLGDHLYRVTRTRQKSGKATLNIAEQVDGEWADRSCEKLKDTQQEIENIIGMDSLTLKACALIMQDQYGLFLQADKEARMNILGSILGLGVYADMEELAANGATEANRGVRSLTDKIDAITGGLPDRDELEREIARLEGAKTGYEDAAASKEAETDAIKVKLNTQVEAAGRVIKLNAKLSTLTSQKASKEAAKTSQVTIMSAADAVLAEEAEITAGVARHTELLEQEKTLIAGSATYDQTSAQRSQAGEAVVKAQGDADTAERKMAAIQTMKIEPLEREIAQLEGLAGKRAEYEAAKAKVNELEKLAPAYAEASDEADRWRKEGQRLEQDYTRERERLAGVVSTLKAKVALLADSGCPDAEAATCKFLADAKAAAESLPGNEAALQSLDEEYRGGCEDIAKKLREAEEAMKEVGYDQAAYTEAWTAMRELESEAAAYGTIEGKRSELAALKEQRDELDAAAKAARETAERRSEEFKALDDKLKELADAKERHQAIRGEIAAAQRWVEKERQLPVARQQKADAAQRVIELAQEIDAIDAEITETRAELEAEREKTVGREELEAKVAVGTNEVNKLRDCAQRTAMELGSLKGQLARMDEKLAEVADLREQENAMAVKAAGYEELKKAFSQDGIPHNIIRSIIPIFEATASNILGQMSGGHMSVEFLTEKTLKSNSKKEVTTLDIIINDSATGRLPYMSRSGGERVKAALSVILALSEIKSSKAGVQLGFLFIDEPPFLDADGTQAYCGALETIQRRYPDTKIMAITHDETFKARFPQSVTVYKDEAGSHVRGD